jgi:hypothetical protein
LAGCEQLEVRSGDERVRVERGEVVPSHETDLPALKHASQRIPSSAILHHLEAIAQPSATLGWAMASRWCKMAELGMR